MSYAVWRRLPEPIRGQIAGCDVCEFQRRRIKTCDAHSNEEDR